MRRWSQQSIGLLPAASRFYVLSRRQLYRVFSDERLSGVWLYCSVRRSWLCWWHSLVGVEKKDADSVENDIHADWYEVQTETGEQVFAPIYK